MKANPSECESVKSIMERVSQGDLLSHYLGINSLPVLISSPFRKDEHPSFFIYSPDGNKVLYQDYATGDSGDIYTLLQRQNNITFSQLMRKISAEKTFTQGTFVNQASNGRRFKPRVPVDVRVKVREWKEHDLEYWNSYGISLQWLKFADVYPISHKIIYKGEQRFVFPAPLYSYVFVERKDGVSLKIYSPFSKQFKWTTSNDGSVVGLWTKIPKCGNKVVICSSLKDALCLWANTGIPAVYVQSETTRMSAAAQEVLKQRYRHVFICFDNDAPGLQDGLNFELQTGFINVVLPPFTEGKDISDLYKAKGREEFIRIIKPLFDI